MRVLEHISTESTLKAPTTKTFRDLQARASVAGDHVPRRRHGDLMETLKKEAACKKGTSKWNPNFMKPPFGFGGNLLFCAPPYCGSII